jgi:hypothetical protein
MFLQMGGAGTEPATPGRGCGGKHRHPRIAGPSRIADIMDQINERGWMNRPPEAKVI